MPPKPKSHLLTMGKKPGHDFVDTDDPYKYTKIGVITRVDAHHMKCDIRLITGGTKLVEVDITHAMAGPRSFLGGIPEASSLVIVAYRRKHKKLFEPVIVGYLSVGLTSGLRFDPFSGINPADVDPEDQETAQKMFGKTVRYKRIKGEPGDIMGMSSSGSEMLLSKDVRLFNRAGDLFELRDVDRTLVTQAIHQVHNDSAVYIFSGGIRRGAMNLPLDIFKTADSKAEAGTPAADGRIVRDKTAHYYGRDDLSNMGPRTLPFIDANGAILDRINENVEFPPLTYSNGRQVFYPAKTEASYFEDIGGDGQVYTERRMEMRHISDLRQSVLEEIDGFTTEPTIPYIELVYGTVVGNDAFSAQGQRQYARILKPQIFANFEDNQPAQFSLEEARRDLSNDQAETMAGAMLLRMIPPAGKKDVPFGIAVSKQGKLFVNLPGSIEESDGYDAKNVSAEINAEGALKIHLGRATPNGQSLHLVCEGGIFIEVGANSDGNCIDQVFHGAVKHVYNGTNNTDDVAHSVSVQGNAEHAIQGSFDQVISGHYLQHVDGGHTVEASSISQKALNGFTGTYGGLSMTVNGKSQLQYAQPVIETIVVGGRVSTILAGGEVKTIAAGGETHTIGAGGFVVTVGAGAIGITAGAGAIGLTAGAGITISAAIGVTLSAVAAVAITSGLAMTLTSPILIALTSAQVLLGSPAAPFGVVRSLLYVPPGTPSLDIITGLPMMSCATVRSM